MSRCDNCGNTEDSVACSECDGTEPLRDQLAERDRRIAELITEEKKYAALRAELVVGRDKMRASGDHGPANWLTKLLGDA